jgi:hypothetical protein
MRGRTVINSMLLVSVLSALAGAQVVLTDDAFTWSQTPKNNYGSQIALVVSCGTNSYFKFSFANLPAGVDGTNIAGASVTIYVDAVLTSGTMDVYAVNGSWSEGAITYNNAPPLGSRLLSTVSVTKPGYLSFNLTSTVQAWLNGTLPNNGIALVPSSSSQISASFDSKENLLTSHTAGLSLVLVSAGPQGPQGVQGPQGLTGPQGPQGPTGATGTTGATGPAGTTGPAGPQGLQGFQGPMGLPGPAGPQGSAGTNGTGFNFRNAFDNSASYAVNDVATFQGATYVATAANQGPNNPTPDQNPAAWSLMAQAGAAGAQGSQGPSGPQGSPGPAGAIGPGGAAGPTGATGPAGLIGPAGPQGPQGPAGPAAGVSLIQQRAALLQWYRQDFAVGSQPYAIAFDGANVWVTNSGGNKVTKLRAGDGSNLGTFTVGNAPTRIAFGGANVWVTNNAGNNVTKLRASDGANLGTLSVGSLPFGIAFDRANLWVTNSVSDDVTKVRASDGANLGTFPVGTQPQGIAFDGANVWVTNNGDNNVTKLRASDGANLGSFAVGRLPEGIAFDGANVWVANDIDGTVSKLPD